MSAWNITTLAELPDASPTAPVSLLTSQKLDTFENAKPPVGGSISWSPALQNWDPWKGANIDEAPLALVRNTVFFICYLFTYCFLSLFLILPVKALGSSYSRCWQLLW